MPSRRAVLAACGSIVLAGCSAVRREPSVTGSWPQRGYDRTRSGVHPGDIDGPESPLTAQWTRSLPSYGGRSTSPLLADGSLYVGYTDGPPSLMEGERTIVIDAINPATGDSQWTTTATTTRESQQTNHHADSLTLADNGSLILLQTSNGLCAVGTDEDEGTQWCFDNVSDGQLSYQPISPAIDDDTVYVGHYRQLAGGESVPVFYAVDLEEGSERWRHEFTSWDGRGVYSAVAVDDVVYLTEFGEGVKALDAADGTELWSESLPTDSAPTVVDGTVFVTCASATDEESYGATALDTTTGEVLWEAADNDDGGGWIPRQLAATADTVYYAAGFRLLARDATTGERRWPDAARQLVPSAVDPAELRDAEPVSSRTGIPAIVGDRIYVGNRDLVVVDRETGSVHTRYDTEDSLENSVAVADDWLYANTSSTLYGLTTCETELFGRCLR
ncbi:PQQ-binding-like beta-propeller repeat protein [Natrialba sp. SSL1]|uniref:outer membrane protein assembly factor BamB family protein n=1 Tax=Natrialba sp. SSL1 TaxID=1869245 RepID=UPI0008F92BF3|nr:PQQ-binding-like beta-propeller repeat protein [Natrialba sp. SSL1]OIB58574.1 adhesin [Natrialba sp. SSL1]